MKWQFKGRAPAWAYVLAVLLLANIVFQLVTAYWIPSWAPVRPDAVHSYPVRFRGGPTFFVPPWLGTYFDYDIYVGFALVSLFGILLWLHRDKLERVG